MEYKFKPRKCICGLSLSGKTPGKVHEEEDELVGLCPRCERSIPVSVSGEPEPEPEPEPKE